MNKKQSYVETKKFSHDLAALEKQMQVEAEDTITSTLQNGYEQAEDTEPIVFANKNEATVMKVVPDIMQSILQEETMLTSYMSILQDQFQLRLRRLFK